MVVRMWRRIGRAVAVMTAALTLVSIGSPVWATVPTLGSTPSCSWPYVTELAPQTSDPVEMQYLDDILVCQDDVGRILVRNDSDLVWAFQDASGRTLHKVGRTAAGDLFASAVRRVYPYMYMAPGESVRLPWGSTDVQWVIHPELSFMWVAQEKLVDRVESTTISTAKSLLSSTKTKKAIVDCVVSAWKSSAAVGGVVYGKADSDEIWKSAFGVGSEAGTCATSWKAAAEAKGRALFPSYVDAVIVVGEDAKVATQVAGAVDDLKRSTSLFRSLVCALPKVPCA